MTNPLGARQQSGWLAVCTSPDVCKTPMGSSTPPVPYNVVGKLEQSSATVPSVRFNDFAAFTISSSFMATMLGDQAGAAKGVKSGTVGGKVEPTASSKNVRAQKNQVVRHGDECTLNSGNTKGEFVANAAASGLNAKAANMAAQAQNKAEDALGATKEAVKSAAQSYKDNVSPFLHKYGGMAMDHGSTAVMAGGSAVLVGTGMVTTGIGAPIGVVVAAGGTYTSAAGGAAAGAGSIAVGTATNMDAAADWILKGKPPDVVALGVDLVQKIALRKVDQLIDKVMSKKGSQPSDKKEATKDKETPGKDTTKKDSSGSNGNGGGITILGKDQARCKLETYNKNKNICKKNNQTPHHVVPDHVFKEAGEEGAYYPGIPNKPKWEGQGLTICVGGKDKNTSKDGKSLKKGDFANAAAKNEMLAEHGKIHVAMDAAEALLGAANDPKGTATLEQLEKAGAETVALITGCDPEDLKRQLREHHEKHKLPDNTRLRADPLGTNPPDAKTQMGTPKGGGWN